MWSTVTQSLSHFISLQAFNGHFLCGWLSFLEIKTSLVIITFEVLSIYDCTNQAIKLLNYSQ